MATRRPTARGARKKGAPDISVSIEAGEFSLGKIFRGVGNLLDLALRMQAEGKDEYREERVFRGKTSTGKDVQALVGFSVRTATGAAKGAGKTRTHGAEEVERGGGDADADQTPSGSRRDT